ncbi:MAG TPA: C2H2-type zinc finger protein [Thermoplasmata archaeon]|nr:C2H2-type zinc finger protein [Thermoplasmata archaeon]HUJ77772.1 C2H2-type zinc finger protein [Thermoplasmata archaeon]
MAPYVDYDEARALCSECGRQFPDAEALAEHRLDAHGAEPPPSPSGHTPVTCSVCRRRFPHVSALARHNRTAHTS